MHGYVTQWCGDFVGKHFAGPVKQFFSTASLCFFGLTLLIGLIVVLAIGEMMMRSREPIDLDALTLAHRAPNPARGWAYMNPFSKLTPRPGMVAQKDKSINDYGFISTPPIESVKKPARRIRVAFLGGSSTAGTGLILPDKDTWPQRAYEHLQKLMPGRDIEIINAAVGGYSSFESYGRLWSQVRFFEPDIVIVYHAWNEMYYFHDASPEAMLHKTWKKDGGWCFPDVTLPPRFARIRLDKYLGRSQLYAAFRVAANRDKLQEAAGEIGTGEAEDRNRPLAADYDPRGVEVFRDNLKLMEQAAHQIGAEFYVAKQATLVTPDLPEDLRKERCFIHYHQFDYDAHVRAFDAVYKMIEENFPTRSIIDATRLSGSIEFLNDHVHPLPAGCNALGKIVAEHLAAHSRILNKP